MRSNLPSAARRSSSTIWAARSTAPAATSEAAETVVAEIKAAGGTAIANGASVTDDAGVAHLVKQTMDTFGRIDILIANAGILRDKSFAKMEIKDFTP